MTAVSAYTAETLNSMKVTDLRRLAQNFGIQEIKGVKVGSARKDDLAQSILLQQEFNATFVSAEGRHAPRRHPVHGWPIAGEEDR